MSPAAATRGSFELSATDGRRLAIRMTRWTLAAAAAAGAAEPLGFRVDILVGVAVGAGVVAARPMRAWLLPLIGFGVLLFTAAMGRIGLPVAVAAGAAAGLAVGTGSPLARLESLLAGVAGGGFGHFLASSLPLSGVAGAIGLGAILGVATALALVPGALRFAARFRLPPGRFIARSLAEVYRPPCYRALQLDEDVTRRAAGRDTREGLREVAGWVYRLALTLQTLDRDIDTIQPEQVAARRAALDTEDPDPFIQDRRRSTRGHLDRLLQHHDGLVRERARAASLQEYALAWLEEARAGLALAQRFPAEATPEGLDDVLEKLRAQASEVGARRDTARELGFA